MANGRKKNVYIIAGPNGSGKTTFARMFLPEYVRCPNFVNADLIATGLSPFAPDRAAIRAGKLVLEQIRAFADHGVDFAFETTLAGRSYARLLDGMKKRGYALHLFFLWIPQPGLAIARIRQRVAEGGHSVPAADVRRRFDRGIRNFFAMYRPMMDRWMVFDNSGIKPILIANEKDGFLEVIQQTQWEQITSARG